MSNRPVRSTRENPPVRYADSLSLSQKIHDDRTGLSSQPVVGTALSGAGTSLQSSVAPRFTFVVKKGRSRPES